MKRHFVKPGVTGLAQVSGYRGEWEDADMINRVKLDVFYIENWSSDFRFKKLFIKLWLISIKEKIKPISMESALVSIIIPTYNSSQFMLKRFVLCKHNPMVFGKLLW
jgi:glycosyltransferase involved in cell wall biosynthesis